MNKNPGSIIEETIRRRYLKYFFDSKNFKTLLDLGCGMRPYMDIYSPVCKETIGADLPDSPFVKNKVDIFCSATKIPLSDCEVDIVLIAEILHDIEEPSEMFCEIKRILSNNGTLVITSPFMVPICDGKYDHYRYTKFGLEYQLKKHGFENIEIHPIGGLIASTIQFGIKPILKSMNWLEKKSKVRIFTSYFNPVLLLLVFLPQWIYLGWYSIGRKIKILRKIQDHYSYGCIGYVTTCNKV